jgi:CRP-like cAMP-binding protein
VVGAHQVLIERGATAERIYFLVEGMVKGSPQNSEKIVR